MVIQGDITDYDSVLEASHGADVIIHTASLVDVWHRIPETVIYSVNVTGEAAVVGMKIRKMGGKENIYGHSEETNACSGVKDSYAGRN